MPTAPRRDDDGHLLCHACDSRATSQTEVECASCTDPDAEQQRDTAGPLYAEQTQLLAELVPQLEQVTRARDDAWDAGEPDPQLDAEFVSLQLRYSAAGNAALIAKGQLDQALFAIDRVSQPHTHPVYSCDSHASQGDS